MGVILKVLLLKVRLGKVRRSGAQDQGSLNIINPYAILSPIQADPDFDLNSAREFRTNRPPPVSLVNNPFQHFSSFQNLVS